MVIRHSCAVVGFVEKQSNTADDQQHTQVLSQGVFLSQYRDTKNHHCKKNKMQQFDLIQNQAFNIESETRDIDRLCFDCKTRDKATTDGITWKMILNIKKYYSN